MRGLCCALPNLILGHRGQCDFPVAQESEPADGGRATQGLEERQKSRQSAFDLTFTPSSVPLFAARAVQRRLKSPWPKKRKSLYQGCVDFDAPPDYMTRPPQPPLYVFVLDVSNRAVQVRVCVPARDREGTRARGARRKSPRSACLCSTSPTGRCRWAGEREGGRGRAAERASDRGGGWAWRGKG